MSHDEYEQKFTTLIEALSKARLEHTQSSADHYEFQRLKAELTQLVSKAHQLTDNETPK